MRTLPTLLFLAIQITLFSQTLPDIKWDNSSQLPYQDVVNRVVENPYGNFTAVGTGAPTNYRGKDFIIYFQTKWGKQLKSVSHGGKKDDGGNAICNTFDGGYLVAGYTESQWPESHGKRDGWLVKVNQKGAIMWDLIVGSNKQDELFDVIQDDIGNFIATGNKANKGYVIKISASGEIIWEVEMESTSSGSSVSKSLILTNDQNIVLTGYFGEKEKFFPFLQKLDAKDGSLVWKKEFSDWNTKISETIELKSFKRIVPNDVIACKDNGFAITGTAGLYGVRNEMFFIKTDSNGELMTFEHYGGKMEDGGYAIIQMLDENFLIAGYNSSASGRGDRRSNSWINYVDIEGKIISNDQEGFYGGEQNDEAHDILFTKEGAILLGGFSGSLFDLDAQFIRLKNVQRPDKEGIPVIKIGNIEVYNNDNSKSWKSLASGYVSFMVTNNSDVDAFDITAVVLPQNDIAEISFLKEMLLPMIPANSTKKITIPLETKKLSMSQVNKFTTSFISQDGIDISPFNFEVVTAKEKASDLSFVNHEFIKGEGKNRAEAITLAIDIENKGDGEANGVQVVFILPDGVTAIDDKTINFGNLSAGIKEKVNFRFTVDEDFVANIVNIETWVMDDSKNSQSKIYETNIPSYEDFLNEKREREAAKKKEADAAEKAKEEAREVEEKIIAEEKRKAADAVKKAEEEKIAEAKRQKEIADAAEEAKRVAEEQARQEVEAKRIAVEKAREEAEKIKIEEEKRKAAEAKRIAEEAEAKAVAEKLRAEKAAEAKRIAEEAAQRALEEKERAAAEAAKAVEEKRLAEEAAKKAAEDLRKAKEEEAKVKAEEAKRIAAEKQRAAELAEQKAVEEKRLAEEAERKAAEEKRAAEEAERKAAKEKEQAEKEAKEAEEKRLAEERVQQEAEQQRIKEEQERKEAEAKRLAKEAARKEAETKRLAEEKAKEAAEKKRIAEEVRIAEEKKAQESEAKRLAEEKAKEIAEAKKKMDDDKPIEPGPDMSVQNIAWTVPNPMEKGYEVKVSNRPVIDFKFQIQSTADLKVDQLQLRINNDLADDKIIKKQLTPGAIANVYFFTASVKMNTKKMNATLEILNEGERFTSKNILFQRRTKKPNLHIYAFGIPHEDLNFSVKDAEDFSNEFEAQGNSNEVYGRISINKYTTSDKTTSHNLRDAMIDIRNDYVNQRIRKEDFIIIFFSSHGFESINDNRFKIAGSNYDVRKQDATAIDFEDQVLEFLGDISAKKLIFLDACHSGSAIKKEDKLTAKSGNQVNTEAVSQAIAGLSESNSAFTIFASCSAEEKSYENPKWQNGAFTKSIIEAFNNVEVQGMVNDKTEKIKADQKEDRIIYLDELYQFTRKRIPTLIKQVDPKSKKTQTPYIGDQQLKNKLPIFVIKK